MFGQMSAQGFMFFFPSWESNSHLVSTLYNSHCELVVCEYVTRVSIFGTVDDMWVTFMSSKDIFIFVYDWKTWIIMSF